MCRFGKNYIYNIKENKIYRSLFSSLCLKEVDYRYINMSWYMPNIYIYAKNQC